MPVLKNREDQIADCELVFGGRKLDQTLLPLAISVSVDLAVGKPGMFALEMEGYDENQSLKWMESDMFRLGTIVEVKMGYQESLKPLFFGEVMGMDASFSSSQPPRMTVRAYDLSHRLTKGEKRRAFSKLKSSDIARKIATEAGLTPRVTDSGDMREYVEQKGLSDMAFLLTLAEEINYHLFMIRKEMVFQPALKDSSASVQLSMGDTLTDFQPNLSLARQVSGVIVRGWDVAKGAAIAGRARAGDEASTMGGEKSASKLVKDKADSLISNHPVTTQDEAEKLAHARLNEISLDFIEASGTAMGGADLLPGEVIEIDGVSKWFSGRYYLTGTTHRYDYTSGYTTSFAARRNSL